MVQQRASRSISSQTAFRTSPDLAAVRTMKANASFTTSPEVLRDTARSSAPTSEYGQDAWCSTTRCFEFFGRDFLSWSQASLSSPSQYPIAAPWLMTVRMRWRTRDAVSAFSFQIGRRAARMCSLVTSPTGRSPNLGKAYVDKVLIHCAACLAFFQSSLLVSWYSLAQSEKVMPLRLASNWDACNFAFSSRRYSIGSWPSARICL